MPRSNLGPTGLRRLNSVGTILHCVVLVVAVTGFAACSLFEGGDDISIRVVEHSPKGNGTGNVVSSNPAATISCNVTPNGVSGACYDDFKDLDGAGHFDLVATPDAGSMFVEWGGCPDERGNVCRINISQHKESTVSARFDL